MNSGPRTGVAGPGRGHAPSTSHRELQVIALRVFTERGLDTVTMEQIAASITELIASTRERDIPDTVKFYV